MFETPPLKQMQDNLRDYLIRDSARAEPELQPQQSEALYQANSFLHTDIAEPIPSLEGYSPKRGEFFQVLSATGTGKTYMFGAMAKAMDVPTLIVTPRQLLNEQTKEEFCKRHKIEENKVVIYDGSPQHATDRERLFREDPPPKYLITTYQSLHNLINIHDIDFTRPGGKHYRPLVILDEVHTGLGRNTLLLLRKVFADAAEKGKIILGGFTATDVGTSRRLFRGQPPVYNLPLVTAIERNLLCRQVEARVIDVTLDSKDADMVMHMRAARKDREYPKRDTNAFALNPKVIEKVVQFHMQYEHEEMGHIHRLPTIFYTQGVKAAALGAQIFNETARTSNIPARAAYISGKESLFVDAKGGKITNRQEILRMFKEGTIQALWNDSVLEMGFDDPNATVCYSLKNSRAPHVVEQQLGRITRKENEEYVKRYGHSKIALAFNICPEGVNPYFYTKVLRGMHVVASAAYKKPPREYSSGHTNPAELNIPDIKVYTTLNQRNIGTVSRYSALDRLIDQLNDPTLTSQKKLKSILARFPDLNTTEGWDWIEQKLETEFETDTFNILRDAQLRRIIPEDKRGGWALKMIMDRSGLTSEELAGRLNQLAPRETAASSISRWSWRQAPIEKDKTGYLIGALSPPLSDPEMISVQEAVEFILVVNPDVLNGDGLDKEWLKRQVEEGKWKNISYPALNDSWLKRKDDQLQKGLRLQAYRESAGLSQTDLATEFNNVSEYIKISQDIVSLWEKGSTRIPIDPPKVGYLVAALKLSGDDAKSFIQMLNPHITDHHTPQEWNAWIDQLLLEQNWEHISFPALNKDWINKQDVYGRAALQLRAYRERKNLTQTELGERLGSSQDLISRWESTRKSIKKNFIPDPDQEHTSERFNALADILGITYAEEREYFGRLIIDSNKAIRAENTTLRAFRAETATTASGGARRKTPADLDLDLEEGKGGP